MSHDIALWWFRINDLSNPLGRPAQQAVSTEETVVCESQRNLSYEYLPNANIKEAYNLTTNPP